MSSFVIIYSEGILYTILIHFIDIIYSDVQGKQEVVNADTPSHDTYARSGTKVRQGRDSPREQN